jgi:hypothetical protein
LDASGITAVAIYLMEVQPGVRGVEELKEINAFCTDASLISQYCIAVKDLPVTQIHADRYFPLSGARPLQPPLMCCVSPAHGEVAPRTKRGKLFLHRLLRIQTAPSKIFFSFIGIFLRLTSSVIVINKKHNNMIGS